MSLVAAPWVRVHAPLLALWACTLGCAPHTLQSAALVATTAVHTCSSKSLREESKVNPVIEVYTVVQTLVTAEVYACRTLGADWLCSVHLATARACATGSQEIVDSAPTVVEGKMRTVHGHAAVAVHYFANCSEDLQTNAPSVDRGVASVLRKVVEAGKSLYLSPAAVDQGTYSVGLLDGIEHPLW